RLITIAKMDDFISRTPVDRLCANLPGKHNYQSGHYWWLSADGKKIACIPHDYCSMSMPANLQSASMPVNLQDEVTKADNLEFSNSYNGINYGVEADNQQQYSLMLKFTGTITATPEEKYLQFLIKGINPGNTDKGDNDETNQQKSYVIGGLIDSSNCLLTTKTNQITVDLGKTLQPLNKEQNIYSTNPSGTIIELNAICSNAIISPYIHTTMSDFSTHDQPEKGIIELIADQPESKNNSPLLLYLYTDKTLNQPLSLTTPYKMSESKGLFHAQWYLQDKITASNAQKNAIGHFRRVNLELKYF
ncbi:MAG: hypothetical protein OXC48_00670, partial [Endozoicomonadaceae bacterium]|nr:hypothetical protein [Endozoicomonadaceae bacterium]